jgi:hypothetical protein
VIAGAGHGWGAAVFPLVAAAVAAVFGAHLAVRFVRRRRASEGYWSAALLMFAVGSFAMFLGVVSGWGPAEFRVYWLFGAVLTVPYLFQGEVELLSRNRVVNLSLATVLFALTILAVVVVWPAPTDTEELVEVLPLGREVFGDGTAAHRLAQLYGIPAYFLLLFGLAWSVRGMRGKAHLRSRAAGLTWIAVGATIVAIGSGIGAARAMVWLFSVSLAVGVAVMYWGFLVASGAARRPEHASDPSGV